MFDAISGTQQALLYLAIIQSAAFTLFTCFAVVPLVRIIMDQSKTYKAILEKLDALHHHEEN